MPVKLELVSKPSEQDLQDLSRIFIDEVDDTPERIKNWIAERIQDPQRLLFGGRFNGRLLSLAWLTLEQDDWRLEQLLVLKITRGRGVSRQLLLLLAREAQQQHKNLFIGQHLLPEELTPLLKELQFELKNGDWQLIDHPYA
jgi:GNAT superfamily N-acetyltransferase